jgi:hypothetical protein
MKVRLYDPASQGIPKYADRNLLLFASRKLRPDLSGSALAKLRKGQLTVLLGAHLYNRKATLDRGAVVIRLGTEVGRG